MFMLTGLLSLLRREPPQFEPPRQLTLFASCRLLFRAIADAATLGDSSPPFRSRQIFILSLSHYILPPLFFARYFRRDIFISFSARLTLTPPFASFLRLRYAALSRC
jgi:hypothetical protein